MMENPDKYIRKFFYDKLNGINVNGNSISVFDTNASEDVPNYIILSTQSGSDDQDNKFHIDKNRRITIDIITRFPGIAGSRALADDIAEKVISETKEITIENFTVNDFSISYPGDMVMDSNTETIHRKLIIYELNIN